MRIYASYNTYKFLIKFQLLENKNMCNDILILVLISPLVEPPQMPWSNLPWGGLTTVARFNKTENKFYMNG